MNKKGAVELSMTTIIIIVMGITILSLGLVWIRNVFTDVGELSAGAFEQGASQIADIFGESKEPVAMSPSEIGMDQGTTETVTLAIRDSSSSGSSDVYATVESKAFGGAAAENLRCGFDDTGTEESNKYSLASGESMARGLIVKDDGSDLGTYFCAVTVYNLAGQSEKTVSLVINIE
jgi:hypothetical protein